MDNVPEACSNKRDLQHFLLQWMGWACTACLLLLMLLGPQQLFGNKSTAGKPCTLSPHIASDAERISRAMELRFPVSCTTAVFSKQSCMFRDVCVQLQQEAQSTTNITVSAVLTASNKASHAALLQQHLKKLFNSQEVGNIQASLSNNTSISTNFKWEHSPTLMWRPHDANQYSFGHAMVNEALPIFMVLQNFFGPALPADLQMVATYKPDNVLRNAYQNFVTKRYREVLGPYDLLRPGGLGVCFNQLIVGDGGYVEASRRSLSASGSGSAKEHSRHYQEVGTFFSSNNWWQFRQHVLQLHGLPDISLSESSRPLILLNDKRHGSEGQPDRRMIMNIDEVTSRLSGIYRTAEVKAIRFRDLSMNEQIAWWSRASVFITTQASSSFGLVFLPKGATCLMAGNPMNKTTPDTQWTSFYELDVWFPLTYVRFVRYEIKLEDTNDYKVEKGRGFWAPSDPEDNRNWWLYNSDVRLDMKRLTGILDPILQQQP